MFNPTVLLICGLLSCISAATVLPETKIVGGTAAVIDDTPYQVSLQKGGSHICGGAIYNARIIITAAHCVNGAVATQLKIRYGSSYWASGGTLIGVTKALIHPSYSTSTMEYDVALLKTDRDIVWSSIVLAISLPVYERAGGTQATISGWGTQQSGATSIPSQLRSANVQLITRAGCQSSTYGYGKSVGDTMICAGASGIDTCQGDSGGPVNSGGWLVGIVSWGSGCANSFYPGVYTSVPKVRSFIIDNAKVM